jgi:hemolysin activation/secretion protein
VGPALSTRHPAASRLSRPIGLALAALIVAPALPTRAADTAPAVPTAEPARPPLLPRPDPSLFPLPPLPVPTPAARPEGEPRWTLQRVVVTGNTVLSDALLQGVAAPYVGQPVGESDLEQLRQQLTRAYVERGYLNSGLRLRRAAADEGVAEFEAVEGRLTAVRLRGLGRLNEAYLRTPLQGDGGPLNVEPLRERFQLLLDDPLFEQLNARLLPGSAPGEAVLDVEVTRARPWGLTVFANNYRPVSVGEGALGLSGWVRNLTGQGDLLEGSVQAPTEGSGDLRGNLAWRLPLGHRGTFLTLAADEGNSSVVEESVRGLDITSRLSSREIGLSQTVFESLGSKLSLGLQGVWRENRTWLLGSPFSFNPGEPEGTVRERLLRFWQEYVQRSPTQVLALRSTFSVGRNNLQTIAGLPPNDQPPSHYRVWLGQAQFARQVADNGAQLVARGTLQWSPDRLLALDGLAVGGVNSVRGFRENQLVRDQGAVLNLELEWPLLRDGSNPLRVTVIPFVDHGRGRNRGGSWTTLSSAGVALRAGWRGLALDLAVAHRIDRPAETRNGGNSLQDQGVHLQLSYRF